MKEEIAYILRHQCNNITFEEKGELLIVNLDCTALCGYAIVELDNLARRNNIPGPVITIQSISNPKMQIIL